MAETKNVVISGTNFWNPGDDFVRDGVIRILHELFPDYQLNFLFYNFNQDFIPQSKFSGIHNMVSKGDLELYRDFIDYIVIAGLSAGNEVKDLYNWIINNELTDRVFLIGAGYENTYAESNIKLEPELIIFKNARVIISRTKKVPEIFDSLRLPYHHINCPAILSVPEVKKLPPGRKIEKIAFSIQLPHEIGIPNHACAKEMYLLSVQLVSELSQQFDIEIIAHHKSEYFHFLGLLKKYNLNIPVIFSSFYQDLFEIYPRYDLIITTRLHASLFANGFGLPGIILNDTNRHTYTLEGFPHSVWVNSKERFYTEFEKIKQKSLHIISEEAKLYKENLLKKYISILRAPFGSASEQYKNNSSIEIEKNIPVHFFTIVLNGMPFIEYHVNVFKDLPFKWQWHIMEGVADLKNDTAWSLENGAQIFPELHNNGLSNDGTSEYLDNLQKQYPGNITVYRKKHGIFWDGKLEMVNAPLSRINEECILWEIDADELWTTDQLIRGRQLYIDHPQKTASYYRCNFFVGEKLVINSINTYGNHTEFEWLRSWMYKPGDKWITHEPPQLCRLVNSNEWFDIAKINPFEHSVTEQNKLIFQHYAYVLPSQVKFKEKYYGYKNALSRWEALQKIKNFPVFLRDYFDWVNDNAEANLVSKAGIIPLASIENGNWEFKHDLNSNEVQNILFIRTDSIGDNVLASSMLKHIKNKFNNSNIIVVCQNHIKELYEHCPYVKNIISIDKKRFIADESYRYLVINDIRQYKINMAINAVFSSEMADDMLCLTSGAGITIKIDGDSINCNQESVNKVRKLYTHVIKTDVGERNELIRYKDFLNSIDINVSELIPEIWINEDDEMYAGRIFEEYDIDPKKTIILFAGAQNSIRYFDNYGKAISNLCFKNGFNVLALGTKEDLYINQKNLDELLIKTKKINLSGKTSIRQAAAIIKRSRIAIGAETGNAHIACAVGTRNLILLGGGHFGRFMPYSNLSSIVCFPLNCYGCNWICSLPSNKCIKDISLELIEFAFEQSLMKNSQRIRIFVQDLNFNAVKIISKFIESDKFELIPYSERSGNKSNELIKNNEIRVSAIISTYNSEKFLKGCLDDLLNQTLYKKGGLEIVVVNSGSTQNEESIIKEYQSAYKNIKYLKTERETVYKAWNRGIKIASGKYITNANTDDRHRKDALEILAGTLDENENIGLVYADQFVTKIENQTFEKHTAVGYFNWPAYNRMQLLHCSSCGPQPMWRKSLHEKYGYFDESLKVAGDYEWWLRISEHLELKHIPEKLGLYLLSDDSIEHSLNDATIEETNEIRKYYSIKAGLKDLDYKKYKATFLVLSEQNQPVVSVVIPTYNRKDKLAEAIQSVFSQSYENFEIIVVNDAGTSIMDIIESFNDFRIRYFEHKSNKGLASARNTGLKNACGKYIAYLDDDDIFYPDHLETLVSFLENNNYSVAYTDSYKAVQELRNGNYVTIEKSLPFSNDFSRDKLLELNIAPVLCFMHAKSCIEEVGLFDETLKAHEDWDFWIRLSRKFDFVHIKKITSEFRQRNDKSSMTGSQHLDFYNSYRDIVAKHYNLSKNNPALLNEQINNLRIIKQRTINASQMPPKEKKPSVSIIIPVYNKVNFTQQCLLTLYQNTSKKIDFEVIVVNNASTDETSDYLGFASDIYYNLKVITNLENLGFARANNLGVKQAQGKYILFLNNDTEVQKGWLEALFRVIKNDRSVAAVGSKLLFPDGSLQHAGVIIIEDKQLPDPLVARHIYWQSPGDLNEANQLKTYQALTAACLLIKKTVFIKIGGFDEEYWNGYEDVDLCFKIGELGYNLVYQPESIAIHYESQSGPERFSKVVHNIDLLHKKWLGRIQPDYILEKNGEAFKTSANKIKDYFAPGFNKQFSKDSKTSAVYDISIIVLTYNGLEYTKQFIESLYSKTQNKFELLVIDNNSNDGTVEFLKELSENNANVSLILNKNNLGFPAAINQGLKKSTGNHIVIANNDIVLTNGWLERMINIAEADPQVGLVGPLSNSVSGMQLDKEAKYSTITEMHNYAAEVKQKNTGSILEFPRVAFLCTLVKKEVIEKIGGLDERFSPGNFEDDDFCLRAQIAGYKTVIAKDVFIHHFGSKSFAAEGLEKYRKRLETNQKIFVNKWGATPEEIWLQGKQIKGRNIMFTLDKNEFTENLQRALSLIEEKDFDVALDYLKNSVELYNSFEHDESDPELANLLNLAGNISLLNGNTETAQKYFENALNEDKNSSHACAGLGEVLFAKESYEAAKTMYEWGVKNNPENKAAIDGLAKINKIFNLPEDDNSLFKSDGEMNFVNNSNENNESKADKLINEAYEMFNENRFIEALDKLSQAEKIFNGHLSSPYDIDFAASFYNMKGFNYLGLNDIDNAKACFQKALDINPASSQACAGLGEILYLNKYDEQAKIMFKKAVEINPNNLFAVNGLEKINKILNNNHDKLKINHRDDLGRLFNELELCGKGVEVGVQAGVYSQTLRNTWKGEELYLVDRWKYSSDYKDIANIPDEKQMDLYLSVVNKFADDQSVQIIKKDSVQASKQFPDEFFDWIYLDADHSYNGCTNDLKAWYPKLKKGGVFAGHDYLDGEFIGGSFGVKSAVDDFIRDKDVNLYLTDENTVRSWYFLKPVSAIPSVAEIKTNERKLDIIEKDNQKLQSVLNEILEASYELFNLKHFREAIETLNKSEELFYLQNNTDLISSFENMKGFNYLGLDDKSGARKCFETALNINPESSQACAGLGELFYLDGKDKEAKTMYEYAVKNNPENPFAVSGLEKINKILDYPETHNTLMNY